MPQTRQNKPFKPAINIIEDSPHPILMSANNLPLGGGIPWHHHNRAQLVFASRGVMTVTTHDAAYVVPPQRAVWMPGNIEHQIDANRLITMRSLYIDTASTASFPTQPYVLQVTPLLRELIMVAFTIGNDYALDSPASRIMQVILDQINSQSRLDLALPLPTDPRLLQITQALMADPANQQTLEEWGKEVGASRRTLNRLFSKQTELSFQAWRQQLRLHRALELLMTGDSVTWIAAELGYENTSAFIAMFRRCTGTTPKQYLTDTE